MNFSSFETNSRGVAILVHKNVPFELTGSISDIEGRYILLNGKIWGKHITLLNVYAPNSDTPTFIYDMVTLLNIQCSSLGVMGGN